MSTCFDFLDYPTLLNLPSQQALLQALSKRYAMDMATYVQTNELVIGNPTVPVNANVGYTEVAFTDPQNLLRPAKLGYQRIALTDYLTTCGLYVAQPSAGTTPDQLPTWFSDQITVRHKVTIPAADITVALAANPTNDWQVTAYQISIASTNYVWVGQATLLAVPDHHLALYAQPGVATGIQYGDVNLPDPSSATP